MFQELLDFVTRINGAAEDNTVDLRGMGQDPYEIIDKLDELGIPHENEAFDYKDYEDADIWIDKQLQNNMRIYDFGLGTDTYVLFAIPVSYEVLIDPEFAQEITSSVEEKKIKEGQFKADYVIKSADEKDKIAKFRRDVYKDKKYGKNFGPYLNRLLRWLRRGIVKEIDIRIDENGVYFYWHTAKGTFDPGDLEKIDFD